MTATNHALTGALIGLSVHNPWLALPAALVSHLICDIIPHFGIKDKEWIRSRNFLGMLAVDILLCIVLVAVLFTAGPANWLLAAICAFVATSPDLLWIREFVLVRQRKVYKPFWLERFLVWIQWFQKPIGAYIEAAWFIGTVTLLWQFL
jgi:hypothetical protein